MALDAKLVDHRKAVISGHDFNVKLNQDKVVRVFLSSTFKDFIVERDQLFNNALPVLEEWCAVRGLEFQVVDLRWGIKDHAVLDHGGANLCIKEVQHCQQKSIGPNFVAFVGDRYGHRPLPKSIKAEEFTYILNNCESATDKRTIEEKYQIDANVVPPVYVLKYMKPNDDESETEEARQLRQALTDAVGKAHKSGQITQTHPYTASVTEQEIWQGLLNVDKPDGTTLCFIRNFKDLTLNKEHLEETMVFADYVPPINLGQRDPVSTSMLAHMKKHELPRKMKSNATLFEYKIPFDNNQGVNPSVSSHAKYLEKFTQTFIQKLQLQIMDGLNEIRETHTNDRLYQEVARHATFAVNKTKFFCGQNNETFDELYRFLQKPTDKPLALHGASGVGKTATVAKLVQEIWTNLLGVPNVIYRFLGTTPRSSRLDLLLESIVEQIDEIYGFKKELNEQADCETLIQRFFAQIKQLEQLGQHVPPLLIILDSLDQLSPSFQAHTLHWLPVKLPSNVQVFMSVMIEAEQIWDNLRPRTCKENIFELKQITNDSATKALVGILSQQGRTLQYEQLEYVRKVFEHTQNPLFLHLVAVEASRWHSYTERSQLKLGKTLIEAVNVLFDRLEHYHGPILVSRAMGYIVIAKNGLTEQEMEEILSLDNEVLDEVYEHWLPPSSTEIQIPQLVWTRFKQDLADFIMSRQGDVHAVMGIYHKQFTDVVKTRYLANDDTKRRLHKVLVEFFTGQYGDNVEKPAKLKIYHNVEHSFSRHVRMQPLQISSNRYNLRKLNELPHHLLGANTEDGQQQYLKQIVYDFNWWKAQLHAHSAEELYRNLVDFQAKYNKTDRIELSVLVRFLTMVKSKLSSIEMAEDKVLHLAVYLLATVTDNVAADSKMHSLLSDVRQTLRNEATSLLMEPRNQFITLPLKSLICEIDIDDTSGTKAVFCNKYLVVDSPSSDQVQLWNLESKTVENTLAVSNSVVVPMTLTDTLLIFSIKTNKLMAYNVEKADSTTYSSSKKVKPAKSEHINEQVVFALEKGDDNLIVATSHNVYYLSKLNRLCKENSFNLKQWTRSGWIVTVGFVEADDPYVISVEGNGGSKIWKLNDEREWSQIVQTELVWAAGRLSNDQFAVVGAIEPGQPDRQPEIQLLHAEKVKYIGTKCKSVLFAKDEPMIGVNGAIVSKTGDFAAVVADQSLFVIAMNSKGKTSNSRTKTGADLCDLREFLYKGQSYLAVLTVSRQMMLFGPVESSSRDLDLLATVPSADLAIVDYSEQFLAVGSSQSIQIYDLRQLLKQKRKKTTERRRSTSTSKGSRGSRKLSRSATSTSELDSLPMSDNCAINWDGNQRSVSVFENQAELKVYRSDDILDSTLKLISKVATSSSPNKLCVARINGDLIFANNSGDIFLFNKQSAEVKKLAEVGSPVDIGEYSEELDCLVVLSERQLILKIDMKTGNMTNVEIDTSSWSGTNHRVTQLCVSNHGLILTNSEGHSIHQSFAGKKRLDLSSTGRTDVHAASGDHYAFYSRVPHDPTSSISVYDLSKCKLLSSLKLTDRTQNVSMMAIHHKAIIAVVDCPVHCVLLYDFGTSSGPQQQTPTMRLDLGTAVLRLVSNATDNTCAFLLQSGRFGVVQIPDTVKNIKKKRTDSVTSFLGTKKTKKQSKTCVIV